MQIIYRPGGPAAEYAELALNIYRGCTFGCRYCYGPRIMRKKPAEYFASPAPKSDISVRVTKDARALATAPERAGVLVSFIGDPYQDPGDMLTRRVLRTLRDHDLPFTVLTKAGMMATRDFDLFEGNPDASFGVTLTLHDAAMLAAWEPGAAGFDSRIRSLEIATVKNIRTWVSLEPVIDPVQSLEIIRRYHDVVDRWLVGKINSFPSVERAHDWVRFRRRCIDLLEDLGADYYIKSSLWEVDDASNYDRQARAALHLRPPGYQAACA